MNNYSDPYFGFEPEESWGSAHERRLKYLDAGLQSKLKKVIMEPKDIEIQRDPLGVRLQFTLDVKDLMSIWQLLLLEEQIAFSLFIPQERIVHIERAAL